MESERHALEYGIRRNQSEREKQALSVGFVSETITRSPEESPSAWKGSYPKTAHRRRGTC